MYCGTEKVLRTKKRIQRSGCKSQGDKNMKNAKGLRLRLISTVTAINPSAERVAGELKRWVVKYTSGDAVEISPL